MPINYPNELKALPKLTPPRDAWAAIEHQWQQQTTRPGRYRWWALAAAIALAAVWLPRQTQLPTPSNTTETLVAAGPNSGSAISPTNDQSTERGTAKWVAYSQRLEGQLQELRTSTPSYRGQHAAILSELEDRIANVDWQLELPLSEPEQRELWQQRASLLHDLVTVEASNRYSNLLADSDQQTPVRTLNRPRAMTAAYQL